MNAWTTYPISVVGQHITRSAELVIRDYASIWFALPSRYHDPGYSCGGHANIHEIDGLRLCTRIWKLPPK
jgi:hypothetical protein